MIKLKQAAMLAAVVPGTLFIFLAVVFAWVARVLRATGDAMLPRWAAKTTVSFKDNWARMTPEQRAELVGKLQQQVHRVEYVPEARQ